MATKKSTKKSNTAKFAKKKLEVSPLILVGMMSIIVILGITLIYTSFAMTSNRNSKIWYYNQGRLTMGNSFVCSFFYTCYTYDEAVARGAAWRVTSGLWSR